MEGFPFCCGRCGEGRGVWLLTEKKHRIKLEKKWKVVLMIFFFKYIVFVFVGFKVRDPDWQKFLIWTNFSCFCSEFINWDWFEKFASKSAFGENFSFKYWHQLTDRVISYLLFRFFISCFMMERRRTKMFTYCYHRPFMIMMVIMDG